MDKTSTGEFLIFGFLFRSFINKNWHNSRTGNDTDMQHLPLTKLNKRNMSTSKKFDDYVLPADYNIIVIKLICN